MLWQTRQGRRILGGALVAAAPLVAVLSLSRVQITPTESAPAYRQRGQAAAAVVIAEFSDFQCPACRAAEEPLRQIRDLYGERVRVLFKHFPLTRVHPWAMPAAVAAECAGRQGRFWDLHRLLYERQPQWVESADPAAKILAYGRELKLDEKAFKACLDEPGADAPVRADIEEGDRRWVTSTPTFFVNGRRFIGGRQLATLGSLWIEKALKK